MSIFSKQTLAERDAISARWTLIRSRAAIETPLPPASTAPLFQNIPPEMKAAPRWILWASEGVDKRKVPRRADNGHLASSTDPSTWCEFIPAVAAFDRGGYSGIGFVLGEGWAGIDLDDCLNDSGAFLWGGDIVAGIASYTEVSPSGTGVKIFIRGKKPDGAKSKKSGFGPEGSGQLEVFDAGRYFTVTGQILDGSESIVSDRQDELTALCKQHWPAQPAPRQLPSRPLLGGDNLKRARAYLAKLPPAVSGESGHAKTYEAAMSLFRFGLTDDQALAELQAYGSRCVPPWSDRELSHKISQARKNIGDDFGSKLREDRKPPAAAAKTVSQITASYIPFPVNLLPAPINEYVRQGAAALGCDPAYIAVPLLPVISSAIGNTRDIRLKKDWREPAVIWAGVVGESGTVKSPALDLATRQLWKRQRAAFKEHSQEMAKYKSSLALWKSAEKSSRGEQPEPPAACEHFICGDTTVEALADRLSTTRRGTIVAPDELAGWFTSFNQYKKNGSDVSHWLAMFGARELKVDRKTGDKTTIFVPRAAVAVAGTIQPETLSSCLTPTFFGNGLAARMLLAYPPTKPKRWTEAEIDSDVGERVNDLFDKLFNLQVLDEPIAVELNDSAKERWIKFVNDHGEAMDGLVGDERAAFSKLEGYPARFALLFHCIRVASGEKQNDYIDLVDIENAIALGDWFWIETQRVYGELFRGDEQSEENPDHQELVDYIKSNGGSIELRRLQNGPRKYRGSGVADAALEDLAERGLGHWTYPNRRKTFQLFNPENGDGDTDNNSKNRESVASGNDNNSKTAIVSPKGGDKC